MSVGVYTILLLAMFSLSGAWAEHLGQVTAQLGHRTLDVQTQVPESVLLYEYVNGILPLPRVTAHLARYGGAWDAWRYGGLSLCQLLAKRDGPQPFVAWPSDRGSDECDLSRVILAYGGWAVAGLEDEAGARFTQPILPSVEIVTYGETAVIYLNPWFLAHAKRTAVGAKAAYDFLERLYFEPRLLEGLKVSNAGVALFPEECAGYLPRHKDH